MKTHPSARRSREPKKGNRLLTTLLLLCLPIIAATFISGSFFKLGTLQPGEVLDARPVAAASSGHSEPQVTETAGTQTPGSTTTAQATGTQTPGSTITSGTTTTPGSTVTAGTTTTPGSTVTAGTTTTVTPGSTGTPGGCSVTGTAAISALPGGFQPPSITVAPGTSVTWTNNTGDRARIRDINHVLFDSGDIQPGQTFLYTFCNSGTYVYENSRNGTTGTVVVTGASGTPSTTGTAQITGTPGSTVTAGTTTTPGSTVTSGTTTTPGSTVTAGTTTTPGSTVTAGTTTTPGSTVTAGTTTTVTPGATTTPGTCTISFTDVQPGSTFYPYVQCLACRNVLGGYSDGTFRPNNGVTRGQLSKIVSNAAGWSEIPSTQTFEDVASGHTFYVFVERIASRGVIGGYACGSVGEPCGSESKPYFRPNNPATRGQITKIVSESKGYNDPVSGQTFEDVAPGSTFYMWVERLASRGIMSGYACGGAGEPCNPGDRPYFRPGNNATRGQVAKIVSNSFFPECQP